MAIWNRAEGGAADKGKKKQNTAVTVCFYHFSRGVKREFMSVGALGYIYIEIPAILKTSGK